MRTNVTMPQLGETVSEGVLSQWLKDSGAPIAEGEPLFEVSTDKVDTEVAAPASGILAEILVKAGETVPVGTTLAVITDSTEEPAADEATSDGAEPEGGSEPEGGRRPLTPLIRRLLAEHGLTEAEVTGSGTHGRITRADVMATIAERADRPAPARPAVPDRDEVTRIPFTAIRRRTAEHMVRSKATAPHTLMAVEADYSAVDAVRGKERRRWRDAEGFGLTYLPFVARAVTDALADFPHLNASVGDDELLVHPQVHLGIAVDLDGDGLVVPVIRGAAERRLRGIARAVRDLADRARARALTADDLSGGTFTISNPGPYGTSLTGAIINQPQVAVLATDAVRPRPVAVAQPDGTHALAVHPVGNLALSFDHRAVDGAYAARFLARIREILERRDWSAEL
ncbi:dihydrolipoamide acetyltransferase family protein [Actinomadura sp. 1N219]|uniref:dihydrolipoamide acetyltransferase family protein n=1 Tax=Actinomadura sp. 1N219 TaxID=3375152 RepID=UPI00379FC07C